MQTVDIVLCTDNNYIIPTGVLITSLLYTNPNINITFHVVSEELSNKSKEDLNKCLIKKYSQVFYYIVNKKTLEHCPIRVHDHITIATYFRIVFPTILPQSINKILYLDGDIICIDKILDLWNIDISDSAAGVVPDIYNDDIRINNRLKIPINSGYFNAGVMLINLEYWRTHNIERKTLDFIAEYPDRCIAHDQDALNVILNGKTKYIHPRYNVQFKYFGDKNLMFIHEKYHPDIDEAVLNPCLLHFTGYEKPWHCECLYPLKNIWFYFLRKTKWHNLKITHKYRGKQLIVYKFRKLLALFNLVNNNSFNKDMYIENEYKILNRLNGFAK
ncbi:glycosyltransferase family 8 protein [Breznakiella homolactica]|uniref:Glycosyltransferase family 8 protein n=1 Tax=Breznakiella homolactica TaxID=2798577 RepID=A0A7T7XNX1_9SPIR|nr:glycosyltransferase family 8 protein [Breznakiella homolactica]QQO09804.1 glycosyltransferase family 8 protein [Breznakiella homolactica]